MRDISASVLADVSRRLDQLKQLSLDDVRRLPEHTSERLMIEGVEVTAGVWHDVLALEEHRVVVQVYRPGNLLGGQMFADGFVLTTNGHRPLKFEELAPFT